MNISYVLDEADTKNPALARLEEALQMTPHAVRRLGVRGLTAEELIAQEEIAPADCYLLKSRSPQAIALARHFEQQGKLVVNNTTATNICQDRVLLSRAMHAAGVAWPQTLEFASLNSLLANREWLSIFAFPVILKNRHVNYRELACKIANIEELEELVPEWGEEPCILQEFVPGDGWDVKAYSVGGQVFAARSRSPLDGRVSRVFQFEQDEIAQEWKDLVLSIGKALDIQIYGVDFLVTQQGPLAVDVNSFHSCYGVVGFDDTFVNWVISLLNERSGATSRRK